MRSRLLWILLIFLGIGLLALVVRLAWKFLSGLLEGAAARRPVAPAKGARLVRDPVCGTYVDESRALTARRGGTVHHFCSDGCRAAFLARRPRCRRS